MRAHFGLVGLLAGCTGVWGDDGTQTGTEVPDYCAESGRSRVPKDEVVDALGFAADEVLAEAAGAFAGAFTPPEGSGVPVVFDVASSSAEVDLVVFTLVTRIVEDGVAEGSPDAPSECPARFEIPVTAELVTDDGAFAESFAGALSVSSVEAAAFTGAIDVADVAGTARPAFEVADWSSQQLVLDAAFDGAWSGSLVWSGASDGTDGDGDTGTIEPSGETLAAGTFLAE